MPTKKDGKKIKETEVPMGPISHFNGGKLVVYNDLEVKKSFSEGESHDGPSYVRVQSEIEYLVSHGRYRPK